MESLGCLLLVAMLCLGCTQSAPEGDKAPTSAGHATKVTSGQIGKQVNPEPRAKSATPRPASSSHSNSAANLALPKPSVIALPGASRVFSVDLDGDGFHEILGADGPVLWARQIHKTGGVSKLWEIRGEGTVHQAVVGKTNSESRVLVVARGVGRGQLSAPLVLQAINPKTGEVREIFRSVGARNEPAHLSIADVDRDGQDELAFAYYESKYMVVTRHLELAALTAKANKAAKPIVNSAIRMATSRVYTDVNGTGGADEIIGRVYGDARGLPGDLKVNLGNGHVTVPTDNGVRGLVAARVDGPGPAELYYADGWVANYGKAAKAVLKKMVWTKDGFSSEVVGRSADEFTFFDLTAIDMDGDGRQEIAARGNKRMTIFERKNGVWKQWTAARFEPVINVAIGRGGDGVWRVFVPSKSGVQATTVERPAKAP